MAAGGIGDGIGGFVVEATAGLSILLYLVFLRISGAWNQTYTGAGVFYSVLAGGMALMAVVGILFFKEPASWPRLLGIALSLIGIFLLRIPATK